jgi:hypothetical protein
MIKKQFTLYLENRPGVLADVSRTLAEESVNIDGISVAAGPDAALVQIIVSNAAKTRGVLKRARIAFTIQDVVVFEMENVPGSLADVAARVAKAGINISYIYATSSPNPRARSYAVVSAPDLERLEKILG